jgi:hypothetical protein
LPVLWTGVIILYHDNTTDIENSSKANRLKLMNIQNDIIEQMESEKNCHIDKITTEEVLKVIRACRII